MSTRQGRAPFPRHVWSVLCSTPIVEANTGKISLIDIPEKAGLESAFVDSLAESGEEGAVGIKLTLVTMFWCDERTEESEIRIDLVFPDGSVNRQQPLIVAAASEPNVSRRISFQVSGFEYKGLGLYQFRVHQRKTGGRWRRVAAVPLLLTSVEEVP